MALQNFPGGFQGLIGPAPLANIATTPGTNTTLIDAADEAAIFIGRVVTSDGGSHTIDTTGSSSIGWRSGTTTFANAGTTFKVGIAPVDAANGPPARASNTTNVINFDVSASFTGGGGGVTTAAWQTSVPTTGTKTIANGDLVAICFQATARGGADSITVTYATAADALHRPAVTGYVGGAYGRVSATTNALITFSDGAFGYIHGTELFSTILTQTWNSGSATKEYGQLYNLPFPMKVHGVYGWVSPGGDLDVVLYSDPLGTPVAEKTVSIDANVTGIAASRKFMEFFPSPYTTTANQNIGAIFKPGGTNISAYYRTLANATHCVADPWGTSGYGISRASGAFANANSSLDHYYIGLIVGAFDDGVSTAPAGKLVSVARGSPY